MLTTLLIGWNVDNPTYGSDEMLTTARMKRWQPFCSNETLTTLLTARMKCWHPYLLLRWTLTTLLLRWNSDNPTYCSDEMLTTLLLGWNVTTLLTARMNLHQWDWCEWQHNVLSCHWWNYPPREYFSIRFPFWFFSFISICFHERTYLGLRGHLGFELWERKQVKSLAP